MDYDIHIIGAGLAGSEAALVAARNGLKVRLSEMRPGVSTPVHDTDNAAEVVCSNSLGSMKTTTAGGCLKRELAVLGSPLLEIAFNNHVPAGHALAVDKTKFASDVTSEIESNPNIDLVREEITGINPNPDDGKIPVLIATGPLTSDIFLRSIALLLGDDNLYFFDAISPSVAHSSIDFDRAFYGSRYNPAEKDYLNCPFTREEYEVFHKALTEAERTEIKDFEPDKLFEGCLPVEIIASRDIDALRFGPLKPVGLEIPGTGKIAWAVVQLRREQADPDSWNLVGFQTRLKYGEQKRVFRMIPGLENAEFTRLGSMHKNAYIKSPYLLNPTLQVDEFPHILVAGCLAGVEGYVEDIATGHLAGLAMAALVRGEPIPSPPPVTLHMALCNTICNRNNIPFQPVAATLGLLPPIEPRIRSKKLRREALTRRSLDTMMRYAESLRESGYHQPDELRIPERFENPVREGT